MEPVNWGVLGNSKHAREIVIPAMQKGEHTRVRAMASRHPDSARDVVEQLGIPTLHGSYEELLDDPEIDAVYNPLPNHLHVPWSRKSAEAGKHVLCEKPLALSAEEAEELIEVRDRTGMYIQEAFMVRHHPQWPLVRDWVRDGKIGELRTMQWSFGYYLDDPENVRNKPDLGGGGLYDIGCYCITTSRYIFEEEPDRVIGLFENDPEFGVDRLTSAILDFPSGQASFFCSTQMADCQRAQIFGTEGRIELEIPCNALRDEPNRIFFDSGSRKGRRTEQVEELETVDQFTLQGDNFARTIRNGGEQTVPLEDSVANMRVIDALFRSGETGTWEPVE